jgi:hypothetical protein
MDARDRTRTRGQGAGTKPVEKDDSRESPRARSGPFAHEDLRPVQEQEVLKNRKREPSEDFARPGDIETERSDHGVPFPDRRRSDGESGRPVQLG